MEKAYGMKDIANSGFELELKEDCAELYGYGIYILAFNTEELESLRDMLNFWHEVRPNRGRRT